MSSVSSLHGGVLTTPDSCRLAYVSEGAGPTIVFAHGGLTRGSSWIGVTALLRESFTCVMLDQRAHGASDWGGGPQLERAVDDLLFVIDRVGPVHAVVGHSYGALVALEAARVATSEQVPLLAVYEPPLSLDGPIMDRDRSQQISAAVAAGDFEAALRLHLQSPIGGLSPAEADELATSPMLRSAYAELVVQAPSIAPALETVIGLDDAEPYRKIEVPTLLLLGSASIDIPFGRAVDALHAAIPQSEVAVLDGQTHMATLFAPHLVADELRRFLTAA